jgi:ABC-type uncharacterized transport system involved in gliding motility auxiliary subunit
MRLKHRQKLSLLLLLGVVCTTWGGVYCYVEQHADGISLALLFIGLISLVTCFIYKEQTSQGQYFPKQHSPQWRKRGIIIMVVSLSCLFYAGANYFAYSLSFRWDVTQAKQHTLTASTIELIQGVNKPVELTALYVGLPPKYLEDLLKEYERVSNGKINTEIIDPIERIGYAAQFGNVINGEERKVIIRSGDERKDVDFSRSALTEEQLANALVRVTREQRQVYFLTGHGEFSLSNEENEGLSLFATLLAANNVANKNLMLGIEQSIPDDCDVLVIAGPRNELTETERGLIEDYLKQGGDALFLIENVIVTTPDKPLTDEDIRKNPSLNGILNQWGVNVGTDIVVDLSSHVGKDVGSPATRNYVRHKAITSDLDYTFYVRPRSLSVLEERRSTIKLAPIVLTATKERSWAETNRTLDILFDEGIDLPGPVPISFVIMEEKEEGDRSDTRIIVFTDADFLTNVYINQYSNAEMGLNIINWLSEVDYTVFLDQKEINVERLDLTSKQRRMIASILFLMPLFIAIGGIFVWMRR